MQYTYQVEREQRNLDKNNALAIDLGIDNLATCVTNTGKSFIVDGKKLKSINQWFNKYNSKLQSIKDKQCYGKRLTMKQKIIWNKRNNRVNDYLSKSARIIINYCLENNIGILVCGYNNDFQRNSDIGKRIKRGVYKTSKGYVLNADINGALNILRKSKVVDLEVLYHRGKVDTPVRIRVS